jgi:hypothetical protein
VLLSVVELIVVMGLLDGCSGVCSKLSTWRGSRLAAAGSSKGRVKSAMVHLLYAAAIPPGRQK